MILGWLVACSGSVSALPAGDPARPDVLVLSVDTLRADHLGAWGYDRPTSPNLDRLAASGTRFASAWSATPWTLPSHATMLTGRLPPHHGAIEDDLAIAPEVPLIAETFQAAGYRTLGAVATIFVGRKYGFDRGFDVFEDFGIQDEKKNLKKSVTAAEVYAKLLTDAAATPPGTPIFAFAHVYDVHYPYDAPAPFDTQFDRAPEAGDPPYKSYEWSLAHPLPADQMAHQVAQYDEEIASVDVAIGGLLASWGASGRALVVVVVADHGEEFGERGGWGHAHTLYPEELHVPWIVAGPGIAAQTRDDRVGLEDLAPTLAGLAGLSFPGGDGVDRSGEVEGRSAPEQVSAKYADTSRFATNRLRWHEGALDLYVDLVAGTATVCDLANDPGCTRDIAPDRVEDAVAMRSALYAFLGAPLQARAPGRVTSKRGVFLAYGESAPSSLTVSEGTAFAVVPPDAAFAFHGDVDAGPWRILGGKRPGDADPIGFVGVAPASGGVALDAAERARLESLGYVEGPDPD
jgi:arylsulfatase A-like enzyme